MHVRGEHHNSVIFKASGGGTATGRFLDANPGAEPMAGIAGNVSASIDGTPSKVAGLLLISGATLVALKMAGFRFNVGVSN